MFNTLLLIDIYIQMYSLNLSEFFQTKYILFTCILLEIVIFHNLCNITFI